MATAEIVHPVPVAVLPAWARSASTTFLGDPRSQRTVDWIDALGRTWDPDRAWGARERDDWVATLRTDARTLTVPGLEGGTEIVGVDALTNVTVSATHRRRGLMSRMLLDALRTACARGDALSILISAEWPIYGRFGYAPATLSADYVLRRSRSGSVPPGDPGRVRQVEIDEFARVAPAVFATARRQRVGQIDRDGVWWARMLGLDGYARPDGLAHNWLVHEGEGGPDGLLGWKADAPLSGLVPPFPAVDVWVLAAGRDGAYLDLWAYLAAIDLADEVKISNRPVDEPVRWLLPDARTLVMTQQYDFLWLRILDVPAALTARRYATEGELVLEVTDDIAPGRFVLRADGERVECEPTGRPADVEITQRALASIYLGGFRLAQLALAGGVREHTSGAIGRLDLMFSSPLPPWNATWF